MLNKLVILNSEYQLLEKTLLELKDPLIISEDKNAVQFLNSSLKQESIHCSDLTVIKPKASSLQIALLTIISVQETYPSLMHQIYDYNKLITELYEMELLSWAYIANKIPHVWPKSLKEIARCHINHMLNMNLAPSTNIKHGAELLADKLINRDVVWLCNANQSDLSKQILQQLKSFYKNIIIETRQQSYEMNKPELITLGSKLEELLHIEKLVKKDEAIIISNDVTFRQLYKTRNHSISKTIKLMNIILDAISGMEYNTSSLNEVEYLINKILDMRHNKAGFIHTLSLHIAACHKITGDMSDILKELSSFPVDVYVNDYRSAIYLICDIIEDANEVTFSLSEACQIPAKRFILQGMDDENWHFNKETTEQIEKIMKKGEVFFTRVLGKRQSTYKETEFFHKVNAKKTDLNINMQRKIIHDRPNPTPPIYSRSLSMHVSSLEILLRNPYAYYARYILKLNEKKNNTSVSKELGIAVHEVMDRLQKRNGYKTFSEFENIYNNICKTILSDISLAKHEETVIARRLTNLMPIVFRFLNVWSHGVKRTDTEYEAYREITITNGTIVKLKARSDRIDMMNDGSIRITDYKTGVIPSQKEVDNGKYPQLPIEAIIHNKSETSLFYLDVSGRVDRFDIKKIEYDQHAALSSVTKLMDMFVSSQAQGYFASITEDPKTNIYKHLSRMEEWNY